MNARDKYMQFYRENECKIKLKVQELQNPNSEKDCEDNRENRVYREYSEKLNKKEAAMKEKVLSKKKDIKESIDKINKSTVNKQLNKFKNVNSEESKVENQRKNAQIRTVVDNENLGRKVKNMEVRMRYLKENSVYKKGQAEMPGFLDG